MNVIATRNGHYKNKFKNGCFYRRKLFYFLAILLVLSPAGIVIADGSSHKIPGIDREPKKYTVPKHLGELTTEQIESLRNARQSDLDKLRGEAYSRERSEQNMFNQLMAHDEVRMSITEVIPQLIDDYEIEGKLKEKLLGYRSTFTGELTESRENVSSLHDYQSYDFRFTAVYMSMLFAFQEHPEFYERLKVDMTDEGTSIGNYRKRLDDSYLRVEKAKEKMDVLYSAEDLENVIDELNQELARRSHL